MTTRVLTLVAAIAALSACESRPAAEPAGTLPQQDLASPQPHKPVCANCSVGIGSAAVPDDDELSVAILSEYVGEVEDLSFIEYTSTSVNTHTFDSSVIDDLNDPNTYDTVVYFHVPTILRGLVVFEIDGSTYYEPVFID